MPEFVDRIDAFQRRHPVVGFPLGVTYKFFDDQGPYLAAILTYYAFISIFPLLLIASSVLGFVLQGDVELQQQLLDSTLSRIPIVGTQLATPEGIQGSTSAVVIGSLTALYGVLGLGQAAQNALNVAWAVPRNSRLNPIVSRWRSLVLVSVAGVATIALTVLTTFLSNLRSFGIDTAAWLHAGTPVLSVLITTLFLSLMMRYTTARRPSFRQSLPGGFAIAVMWQALQVAGSQYVSRVVAKATDINATFALVLGLFALLFLATSMAVIGIEINVVLFRKLYPRALLTPFTDAVELTDADRKAYGLYAKMQRHKGFQTVTVSFDDASSAGDPDDAGSTDLPVDVEEAIEGETPAYATTQDPDLPRGAS